MHINSNIAQEQWGVAANALSSDGSPNAQPSMQPRGAVTSDCSLAAHLVARTGRCRCGGMVLGGLLCYCCGLPV